MQDFQAKWLRSVPCSGCLAAEAVGFHLSLEQLRWEGIQRLMDPKIKDPDVSKSIKLNKKVLVLFKSLRF